MRDLKRANAKSPAYRVLGDEGFEVFTPMKEQVTVRAGKRIREQVPVLGDLLFVHDQKETIATFIAKHPTIQFRYLKGGYMNPMVVADAEMERFIHAIGASSQPKYYLPGELTPTMIGRDICVVGGPLDGYKGKLLSIRGSSVKRLLVDLPGLLCAGVEVGPEMIRII